MGAFNVVVVGVEACGHLDDDGVFSLVRLGAQRGGEVEDVVVYGALEFTGRPVVQLRQSCLFNIGLSGR